jgi:hypothetical protein
MNFACGQAVGRNTSHPDPCILRISLSLLLLLQYLYTLLECMQETVECHCLFENVGTTLPPESCVSPSPIPLGLLLRKPPSRSYPNLTLHSTVLVMFMNLASISPASALLTKSRFSLRTRGIWHRAKHLRSLNTSKGLLKIKYTE